MSRCHFNELLTRTVINSGLDYAQLLLNGRGETTNLRLFFPDRLFRGHSNASRKADTFRAC